MLNEAKDILLNGDPFNCELVDEYIDKTLVTILRYSEKEVIIQILRDEHFLNYKIIKNEKFVNMSEIQFNKLIAILLKESKRRYLEC